MVMADSRSILEVEDKQKYRDDKVLNLFLEIHSLTEVFYKNLDRPRPEYNPRYPASTPQNVIDRAFIWVRTPEDRPFWVRVQRDYRTEYGTLHERVKALPSNNSDWFLENL